MCECLHPENHIALQSSQPDNLSFTGEVCYACVTSFNVIDNVTAAPLPYISGEIEERSGGSNLTGEWTQFLESPFAILLPSFLPHSWAV